MDRKFYLSMVLVFACFFVKAQGTITFTPTNPQVIAGAGGVDTFAFDIHAHTDVSGTYFSDIQFYINYSQAFGSNVFSNNNVFVERLALLDEEVVALQTYKYAQTNITDNGSQVVAITYNNSFTNVNGVPNSTYQTLMPVNTPTPMLRVKFAIVNSSIQQAGVQLNSLMDGNQYSLSAPGITTAYSSPNIYNGDLLTYCLTTLSVSGNVTDESCSNSNGSIDITVTGGTTPYTYFWSNSDTTEDLNNVAAGSYDVTVTDAQGCTGITSFTVNNQFANISPITGTTLANPNSTETYSVTAVSGASYNWSFGNAQNTISSGQGTNSINVTLGVTDTLTITQTDINGCVSSTFIEITVNTISTIYKIGDKFGNPKQVSCAASKDTIYVSLTQPLPNSPIGMTIEWEFDENIMTPTGTPVLGSGINGSPFIFIDMANASNGKVTAQIACTNGACFTGSGVLIGLEFSILPSAGLGTYPISISKLTEGYATYSTDILVESSTIEITNEPVKYNVYYHGFPSFPIYSADTSNPSAPQIHIYPVSFDGTNYTLDTSGAITTDNNGFVKMFFTQPFFKVERDIPNTNSVLTLINSADAYYIVTEMLSGGSNGNYTTAQLIAANVNAATSNEVDIADVALILMRNNPNGAGEFQGMPDWIFIPQDSLSAITNASINNVPSVAEYIATGASASCNPSLSKNMVGILLGDVNLSFQPTSHAVVARTGGNSTGGTKPTNEPSLLKSSSTDSITFANCYFEYLEDSKYRLYFDIVFGNTINSVDFDLAYSNNIQIVDVQEADILNGTNASTVANHGDNRLVLSSYILNGASSGSLYYMDFTTSNGVVPDTSDFDFNVGLINGNIVRTSKCSGFTISICCEFDDKLNIETYPNPIEDYFRVEYTDIVNKINSIKLYNLLGQEVKDIQVSQSGISTVNTSELVSGTYILVINGKEAERLIKI